MSGYEDVQVMSDKSKKRSRFTPEEDSKLRSLVHQYGEGNWELISQRMENRNVRQVRERWLNFLTPNITNDPWSRQEDELLAYKINEFGTRWVYISQFFPNRSDTSIKNRWLIIKKKLLAKELKQQRQNNSVFIPNVQSQNPIVQSSISLPYQCVDLCNNCSVSTNDIWEIPEFSVFEENNSLSWY